MTYLTFEEQYVAHLQFLQSLQPIYKAWEILLCNAYKTPRKGFDGADNLVSGPR